MSKITKHPVKIETRLSLSDRERFETLIKTRNLTNAQLAREAIVFYLDHYQTGADELRETKLERRMRAIETRYASLLVRIGLDVATLTAVVSSRLDPSKRRETMEVAYKVAVKHFNKKLEGVARELKESLSTLGG